MNVGRPVQLSNLANCAEDTPQSASKPHTINFFILSEVFFRHFLKNRTKTQDGDEGHAERPKADLVDHNFLDERKREHRQQHTYHAYECSVLVNFVQEVDELFHFLNSWTMRNAENTPIQVSATITTRVTNISLSFKGTSAPRQNRTADRIYI